MPRKWIPPDLSYLIELYTSGKTLRDIAGMYGVSYPTIRRHLTKAGVTLRTHEEIIRTTRHVEVFRHDIDRWSVVTRYGAGESTVALAKAFQTDPTTIHAILKKMNAHIRTPSEAQKLRFTRPEEYSKSKSRLELAYNAWRGQKHTDSAMEKFALTRERHRNTISPAEIELIDMLRTSGFEPIQQKAVGRYNLDLAIGDVGIEILGGLWHHSRNHVKRMLDLFDRGWHLIFVWVHGRRYPLRITAANYIVTFVKETQGNPSMIRQYRVIRGTGEEIAAGGANLDEFPGVPTGTGRLNFPSRNLRTRRKA